MKKEQQPERGCFVVDDDRFSALCDVFDREARALNLRLPLWRMHEEATPRLCRVIGDRLAHACKAGPMAPLLDELAREVGRDCYGDVPLVAQADPCVRVNPPGDHGLAVPFHTDAWAGNPSTQVAVWIAVVDVVGAEGLWVCSDAVSRACFSSSSSSMHDAQATMRVHARPVTLKRGQAVFFDADVGHGSVVHDVPRTRVSVDLRVAPASALVSTSWRPRTL